MCRHFPVNFLHALSNRCQYPSINYQNLDETGKDKVDLHHEPAFERDVLLNVLLGLRQDLQVKRVWSQNTIFPTIIYSSTSEKSPTYLDIKYWVSANKWEIFSTFAAFSQYLNYIIFDIMVWNVKRILNDGTKLFFLKGTPFCICFLGLNIWDIMYR